MLNKILAPLDGSILADTVLPHLIALTRVNGTVVTLLHVLENSQNALTEIDPVEWHLRKTEAQSYLNEASQRLRSFEIQTKEAVLEGRAADRIVEYAQKEDFDLVAISSHGRGGLSGWNVSSVAHKVIQRIRKSILIIPAYGQIGHRGLEQNLQAMRYRRILVPLDGSPRAECILPLASVLAQQHNADLVVAHVISQPELLQRMPLSEGDVCLLKQIKERNRSEAERYFEQLRGRISPQPQTRILEGEKVERALLKLTEDEGIDLVMLSAHGQSERNRMPYGRLAACLLDYGRTPLYVHQDLEDDEIEPLYAESVLYNTEPPAEHRINAYEYVVN